MSPWPRSLRATLPAPALLAGSEGLDPASDALCRTGSARDLTPALRWYQERLRPPSRQRRRPSPIQSAFHRRRSPLTCACAWWSGAAPPTSAITTIQEHNPGSIRTPMDPPRGRPRDVLRWRWSSTGQCPDGASPAGPRRVAWHPSWTSRFAPRRPLWGQASRRPSDQDQIGFRRTGASPLDESRRIATHRRARSATPTRMARAPSVMGSWT
jgi:hypothetical protein